MRASLHLPSSEHGQHRDFRLDACRGLALWFIFVDHVPDNALAWLTIRNYGFSDTTEVFVFVSGYTCMLAYGGALREQGWATIVARAIRRGWEIYAAFLLLILAYVALIWLFGGGQRFLDDTNTRFLFENPGESILHAMMMRYAPVNTDVLPTFVLLHLAFPLVLWLLIRNAVAALTLSVGLYLMVQLFSWQVPAWPTGELYFNPYAWQVLFVFGAWCAAGGADQLRPLLRSPVVIAIAIGWIAFSLVIALSWEIKALEFLIPEAVSKLIYPIYKSHLAPVRLLHFLALAAVVYRFMPRDWHRLSRPWALAMIRCGENSLSMYCLGVLLSFLGQVIVTDVSNGLAMQIAVSLAGIGVMIAVATLATWENKLDRRGPKLF